MNLVSQHIFPQTAAFYIFQCALGLCELYCQKGFQENYGL